MTKSKDEKIFAALDTIHYALVDALRQVDRPTLMFLAHKMENNDVVSDAAHVVLEDREIAQNSAD